MLPVRLALCDLEAPGWGSLGFRIVLLLLPGSQIVVWHFVVCFSLLFYIAIPIPEVIQCYHLFVHLPIVHELSSCPPAVMFLVLVLFACWCFCFGLFLGFGVCFLCCTVTANGLSDPIQFSFVSHCHYDQCCYCINSAIVINNLASLSWMEVNEIVNFACNHKAGRASRLSGWKKIFACG